MKNLFLNLVVVALISFSVNAQKTRETEQVRSALAKGMASFVETVKPAYKTGQSYADFQKALIGSWKPTAEGTALLKKTHELLSRNTSSSDIQNNYSGKEFGGAYLRIKAIQKDNPKATSIELFGATTGQTSPFINKSSGAVPCAWWDIPCHFANVITFIEAHQATICMIAAFFGFPCPVMVGP